MASTIVLSLKGDGGNCTWPNYNQPNPPLLNLSMYQNVTITGTSDACFYFNRFEYSPCSDQFHCNNSTCVIAFYGAETGTCTVGGYFSDTGVGYGPYGIPGWNMYYWYFDPWPNEISYTSIFWLCDMNLDHGEYEIVNISCGTNNGIPDITMYINTSAVCNKTTTTTTAIPIRDCVWNIGENMLNLTQYQGQTLTLIEDKNNSILVSISPCSNMLSCNGTKVMSYQYDLTNDKCINYLGIFEQGMIDPSYNLNEKEWQFVYTNGQKCNGFENIYTVYWRCDYNTINEAKIVSFDMIGECQYDMHINSSSAC